MPAAHKGAISFQLLYIPIELHTATQSTNISFNQLCPDGSRVRYKKVCDSCGKEVKPDEIIKGYEIEKGKYVTVTDDEIEKIKTKKDRTITIQHFCPLSSIRPIYFDKTYHALPSGGSDEAFELLREGMLGTHTVAIAKTVIGQKEKLLALIPTTDGILAETLFFADEVKAAPRETAHPQIDDEKLKLAKTLIEASVKDFDPSQYHNEFNRKLWELIKTKAANGTVTAAPEGEEPSGKIIDIMEALKASIERQKQQTKPKRPRSRKTS